MGKDITDITDLPSWNLRMTCLDRVRKVARDVGECLPPAEYSVLGTLIIIKQLFRQCAVATGDVLLN